MDESGGLERVVRPLLPEVASSKSAEVLIYDFENAIGRVFPAIPPFMQQIGDGLRADTLWRM